LQKPKSNVARIIFGKPNTVSQKTGLEGNKKKRKGRIGKEDASHQKRQKRQESQKEPPSSSSDRMGNWCCAGIEQCRVYARLPTCLPADGQHICTGCTGLLHGSCGELVEATGGEAVIVQKLKADLAKAEEKLEELANQESELKTEIEKLGSDDNTIEEDDDDELFGSKKEKQEYLKRQLSRIQESM